MKRVVLVFFLMSIFWLNLEAHNLPGGSATGVLKGKIMEEGSDQELSGVKVIILGSELFTYTDEHGEFVFENLPSGALSLVFSLVSFQNTSVEVNVEAGQQRNIELSMAER
jgi:CarboxypepD_reg-like domain